MDFQVQHMRRSSRTLLTALNNHRDQPSKLNPPIKHIKPLEPPVTSTAAEVYSTEVELSSQLRLMIAMVAYLTGKDVASFQQRFGYLGGDYFEKDAAKTTLDKIVFDLSSLDFLATTASTIPEPSATAPSDDFNNTYQISVRESEHLHFSLSTAVTTSDGRVHQVHITESHQRQHRHTLNVNSREVTALIDPLVVNLYGSLNFQSDTTEFDLDSDGNMEQFQQLSHGSFFLALDLNDDGKINDGSELFGTQSGNGFADLRYYDDNGDGLIDQQDAVFDSLRLFHTNDEHLIPLNDAQILAIGLSAIDTPFTFMDEHGKSQAQLRQSSFYVSATGHHGSVQHVDLAI